MRPEAFFHVKRDGSANHSLYCLVSSVKSGGINKTGFSLT